MMAYPGKECYSFNNLKDITVLFSAIAQRFKTVKSQRRTRVTFMSALSNKSYSHYRCAEATLPFSAIAQRFR